MLFVAVEFYGAVDGVGVGAVPVSFFRETASVHLIQEREKKGEETGRDNQLNRGREREIQANRKTRTHTQTHTHKPYTDLLHEIAGSEGAPEVSEVEVLVLCFPQFQPLHSFAQVHRRILQLLYHLITTLTQRQGWIAVQR